MLTRKRAAKARFAVVGQVQPEPVEPEAAVELSLRWKDARDDQFGMCDFTIHLLFVWMAKNALLLLSHSVMLRYTWKKLFHTF